MTAPGRWPEADRLSGELANRSLLCNGCSVCCDLPHLIVNVYPHHGDDPESFETYTVTKDGKSEIFVKKNDAGACIYLGGEGCTIYDRRPAVCRDFDCRRWPNATTPWELKQPTIQALIFVGKAQQRRTRQDFARRFNALLSEP